MKKLPLILLIAFAALFIIWPFYTPDNSSNLRCIDGDTFAIGKKFYRLSYIDTPEKGQDNYKEASKFTCDWMNSNYVLFEDDGIDKYGRQLVIVWKLYGNNDISLNQLLVEKCLAEPFYNKTTDNILRSYNQNCK